MSSVVLKKGVEEPWASERVARFINSLGHTEITLKSDTEPAAVAFRNRVAEKCNAEVTLEDAVKRDKLLNGLVENTVMLLRGVIGGERLGDRTPPRPRDHERVLGGSHFLGQVAS